MGRTLFWLLVSLAVTGGVTLLLWHLVGPYAFFGFLFLPFLFGLRRLGEGARDEGGEPRAGVVRSCPRCGHTSMDPRDHFCPRDGTELK